MSTLREMRVKRDISQEALAKLAGVGVPTLVRLEAGRAVRRSSAEKVCKALGVSLDQIQDINFFSAVQSKNRKVR